jgi:hypothetical protein
MNSFKAAVAKGVVGDLPAIRAYILPMADPRGKLGKPTMTN